MDLVVRAQKRGQFGEFGGSGGEAGEARKPERFDEVVPEIGAVLVVADLSVEQVRLQRQFDGDG